MSLIKWINKSGKYDLTNGELNTLYTLEKKFNSAELEALNKLFNSVFNAGTRAVNSIDTTVWPRKAYLFESTVDSLNKMTAEERLNLIADICDDWDGYRTARGLGGLLNEIWALAAYPVTKFTKSNPSHDKERIN